MLTQEESQLLLSPCSEKDFSFLVNFFYKQVAPHLGNGLIYCKVCHDALGERFVEQDSHSIPTGRCALCDDDLSVEITKRAVARLHDNL